MATHEPITEPMIETTPMPWAEARSRLEKPQGETTHWLSTVREDGRPHVVPVGALWDNGAFYFTTGQGTVKGHNLAQNPHCVISVGNQGIDLVVEGTAERVTDAETLARLANRFSDGGWPATVKGDAFEAPFYAPTSGPAPYDLYKLTPTVAFGFGTTEENAEHPTRWRFEE
jgi:nitroimidazol reductase NimA-like FMN-containing flavoprotein (pyridoxamine 5'-phosphate oxidase superfamily)